MNASRPVIRKMGAGSLLSGCWACADNRGGCYKNNPAGSVGISENLSDEGQGFNWQQGSTNQDEYGVLTLGLPGFEPSQSVLGLQVQGSFQTTGSIHMIPR